MKLKEMSREAILEAVKYPIQNYMTAFDNILKSDQNSQQCGRWFAQVLTAWEDITAMTSVLRYAASELPKLD